MFCHTVSIRLRTSKDIRFYLFGLVLVSTGVLKLRKPSAARDTALKREILNINADNTELAIRSLSRLPVGPGSFAASGRRRRLCGALRSVKLCGDRRTYEATEVSKPVMWRADGGNVKTMTVMGDAAMDRLSDAGSIPARSIECRLLSVPAFMRRKHSSAGMSVRLTRERSRVRAPLLPL